MTTGYTFLARQKSRRAYVVTQSLALALALALISLLIIATIPIELHLLYLPYTCLGARPFHACQNVDPCDLDLRVWVQVLKFALRFRKLIIAPISIEVHLFYLPYICLGARSFYACLNFYPCDLDLDLRLFVQVLKFAFRYRKLIIAPIPIELHHTHAFEN